ncbi:hypothetical protein A2972_00400 [Candidatus Amesbacteria bacterium RIFCSPLOWO2_01_FULL_47_33]|uniref:Uncharacterized protein n=1 Tax=Candidatus Amesbacteria bacterium RIFCSPLOWO2_01_FULL_47_33 TaxID=1797258 RepID=A0A1F4Z5J5_9BACT|nr:MAG: hypothetical protein A2972_00400 [Candidatus Amesbacteria bacterium RIFCSPLOWO2_01_FULL_47_33]
MEKGYKEMGIYEGRPDLKLFTAAALILGNSTAVYMAHLSSRLPEAGAGAGVAAIAAILMNIYFMATLGKKEVRFVGD